jgi:hypothetical protein
MNWKEKFKEIEKNFGKHSNIDWQPSIIYTSKVISENSNDVEAYIRTIYFLHNLLLEENYENSDREKIAALLKKYFDESLIKFSNDAEYLFFIGGILYIAEWYFGLNDDIKPINERQAFKMQKKASEIEPDNILFEWAWRFSLGEELSEVLAKRILLLDTVKTWLLDKGFPGEYILGTLKYNIKD